MHYLYLRLYRLVDVEKEKLEQELKKLGDFIKHRAEMNRDLSYYTLTFIKRNRVDGYIVIGGEKPGKVEREAEIMLGFIESSFESIRAKLVKEFRSAEIIRVPRSRNFYIGGGKD